MFDYYLKPFNQVHNNSFFVPVRVFYDNNYNSGIILTKFVANL